MITNEEYQIISKYNDIIETFIRSKYCTRATVPMLTQCKTIYEKYVKRKINISCDSCVLTLFKILKKYKEEYENNQKNSVGKPDNNNNEGTSSTNRSKRGRKRGSKKTSID